MNELHKFSWVQYKTARVVRIVISYDETYFLDSLYSFVRLRARVSVI